MGDRSRQGAARTSRRASSGLIAIVASMIGVAPVSAAADADVRRAVERGLEHLASLQAGNGRWEADGGAYPVAMTSLAGMAFLLDGATTLQGEYAHNVRDAVGFLLDQSRPNGLIGDPKLDSRYMYGHGFAMLFLSQILGEEEDAARRTRIIETLARAVEFSGQAQTKEGGWGYLSAREGDGFDEGSVTVTQMQGLRGCRNAGVPVPKEIVAKGIGYIEKCATDEGGIRYSLQTNGGARPPITAAAIACLYNAGEYGNPLVAKLIAYCDRRLAPTGKIESFGHWHYAHYYYAQVVYRQGEDRWEEYREKVFRRLVERQGSDGGWSDGFVGPVYATALNLTILQLDNGFLPIYQR